MSISRNVRLSMSVVFFVVTTGLVFGQAARTPDKPRYTNSGSKPFVVSKLSLSDYSKGGDEILYDFDDRESAEKVAADLNDKNKEWTKYFYQAHERPKDTARPTNDGSGAAPSGRPIQFQRPKFVDPGPLKTAAPSVKGKKGRGKIGEKDVTVEFREDGRLVMGGGMSGEGTWEQTDAGLAMRLKDATYRGNVDGSKIAGLRFSRKGSQTPTEWSVKLEGVSSTNRPPGAQSLAGTRWSNPKNPSFVWRFDKSGICYQDTQRAYGDGRVERMVYRWRWKQVGDSVEMTFEGPDSLRPNEMRGKLKDDVLELYYFNNGLRDPEYRNESIIIKRNR